MKKETKPKDPKKVAAGKARAAKALRIGGKFISNKFSEGVKKDMQAANIPLSQAQRFLEQNESVYRESYFMERESMERNYEQFLHDIAKTDNTIYLNGRKVKKATVIKRLSELKRYFGTEFDYWNFRGHYTTSMEGKMRITLPSSKELDEMELTDEQIKDFLEDEYNIEVEDGTDPKEKRQRERDRKAALKERRCHYILNKHGKRCKNISLPDNDFCYVHAKK